MALLVGDASGTWLLFGGYDRRFTAAGPIDLAGHRDMGAANNKATNNLSNTTEGLVREWSHCIKSHLIVIDPKIHSGTPVLLGIRIPINTPFVTAWKLVIRPKSFGTSHHPDVLQI
jgi:hypothetical protein